METAVRPLQTLLVLAAATVVACPGLADDVAGSADNPLVGRFTGASIIYYTAVADDEASLLIAPHDYGALLNRNALADRSGQEWLNVEGKVTRIRYEMAPGHGALEVSKSYRAALEAKGFAVLFECADAACLTGSVTDDYALGLQLDSDNSDSMRYGTHVRYFLAALNADVTSMPPAPDTPMFDPGAPTDPNVAPMDSTSAGPSPDMVGPGTRATAPDAQTDANESIDPFTAFDNAPGAVGPGAANPDVAADPGGPGAPGPASTPFVTAAAAAAPVGSASAIYVAILVGEDQGLTTAFVEIVEPLQAAPPQGNITVVDAAQMAAQLGDNGSVNIYGLHFDTNSATLQPDSRPTLDQISQLLQSQPQLRLAVIGHTDNRGSQSYNMSLSSRRAQSVVAALVSDYGIDSSRLQPSGRGFSQPVASNDTDEGRAQNRRVELVALP
ncbi:MAG: hypothetical protein BGO82_12950 [Devosia sp. 67-54]|nr:MAG: hypothetical protein BGO82_12950 [Devosia sp. 67-54]